MSGTQLVELFENSKEFESVLSSAEGNAKNEWEENFVTDLQDRYARYGMKMYLTDPQLEKLHGIADR
jgi:hypothetical protein